MTDYIIDELRNLLDNGVPGSGVHGPLTDVTINASLITGVIINSQIVGLPVSQVVGLASVATTGQYSSLSGVPTLANVATGGALANNLITGLHAVATTGQASDVSISGYLGTYITDNTGAQIGVQNLENALMAIDAKIGQIDAVFVKDSNGVIRGVETDNHLFDAATLIQALETKIGYSNDTVYPISSVVAELAGSLANLANVATTGQASDVSISGYLGTYITDNTGAQIGVQNLETALMAVDAKIGQIDIVSVKDSHGVIIGWETEGGFFDVANLIQALEAKIGHHNNMVYPISPAVANFKDLSSHSVDLYLSIACGGSSIGTIDITPSVRPFDIQYAYMQCNQILYTQAATTGHMDAVGLKQGANCVDITGAGDVGSIIAGCQYYILNDATPT